MGRLTPNPLRPRRYVDAEKLLDGKRKRLLVVHHGDIIEAVEVGQRLSVGLVFAQLLRCAMQQANVGYRLDYHLDTPPIQ